VASSTELPAAAAQTRAKVAQDALSAQAILEFATIWKLLDPKNLIGTTQGWLQQTIDSILRWRAKSATRAILDYNSVRRIMLGPEPDFQVHGSPRMDLPALRKDLLVTGPGIMLQQQNLGKSPVESAKTAQVTAAGTVNLSVLKAGRDTTYRAVSQDRKALGATRIARPTACGFCQMLQANTYSPANAGFSAHSLCRCIAGPVFQIGQPVPKAQRDAQLLWAENTKGLYGKEALSAFRAAVAGREWNGFKGQGDPRARKSSTASEGAKVPTDASLRVQYSAELKALSKTVGSTKTDASRKYQTDRIAQLERMISLL
jgi:hypothetical protein